MFQSGISVLVNNLRPITKYKQYVWGSNNNTSSTAFQKRYISLNAFEFATFQW